MVDPADRWVAAVGQGVTGLLLGDGADALVTQAPVKEVVTFRRHRHTSGFLQEVSSEPKTTLVR